MNTYWFCDDESGEEFFVEAKTREEAWKVATDIFEENSLNYYGEVSFAFAEAMGLDTY